MQQLFSLTLLKKQCAENNIQSQQLVYIYAGKTMSKNFMHSIDFSKGEERVFFYKIGRSYYDSKKKEISRASQTKGAFEQGGWVCLGVLLPEENTVASVTEKEGQLHGIFKKYNRKFREENLSAREQFFFDATGYEDTEDGVRLALLDKWKEVTQAPLVKKVDLRPVQKKACEHFQKNVQKGHKECLFWMATGTGKTITFFESLRYLLDQKILKDGGATAVISHDVGAQQSFIAESENLYYGQFQIIKDDDIGSIEEVPDKTTIYLISTSDANGDEKEKWKNFSWSNLELIFFDEAHKAFFGKNHVNVTMGLLEKVLEHNPYVIWASGTAANLVENLKRYRRLTDEQVYAFTLGDLLERPDLVDSRLPSISIHILSLPSFSSFAKQGYDNEEEAFHPKKLFFSENERVLRGFVQRYFLHRDGILQHEDHDHVLISVDTIEDSKHLKVIIEEELESYGMDRVRVFLSSIEAKLNDYQEKMMYPAQSITITCNKWLQGVNVPQWDSLLFLNSVNTYEWVFQALGRLLRVYPGKKHVRIFDTVQQRTIDLYNGILASKRVKMEASVKTEIERIYKMIPVFSSSKTVFEEIEPNFEAFYEHFQHYSFSSKRIIRTNIPDWGELTDTQLSQIAQTFADIEVSDGQASMTFGDNKEAKRGKIKRIKRKILNKVFGSDDEEDDETQNQLLQEKFEQLMFCVERFFRYRKTLQNIEALRNASPQEHAVFEEFVETDIESFLWLFDSEILNEEEFDQRIHDLHLQSISSTNQLQAIKDLILFSNQIPHPSPEQIPLPKRIFEKAYQKFHDSQTILVLDKGQETLSMCYLFLENNHSIEEIKEKIWPFGHKKTTLYELQHVNIDLMENYIALPEDWDNWSDTVNGIAHNVSAYIMNPPYNGSDKANKPWVSIVINTITHAAPGSEFLFIVPIHWRTNPGDEYTKVRTCLRTQLQFFEEHHVEKSTFGVGEEISWWIARKKEDPNSEAELTEYKYFDASGDVHVRTIELVDGHPYFSLWKEAYDIVFGGDGTTRYKTKRITRTFKQLNKKEPDLVSEQRTEQHTFRLYNTTKKKGTWYTKRPLVHHEQPKLIIDTSGAYYRANNQNPDGTPIVIYDAGTATAGKNTAVFLESDLHSDDVTMKQFHWYVTHPIMRFLIQEKPTNHSRARFLKELYKVPRIHQYIIDTDSLSAHLGLGTELVTAIYEYYLSKNEDVSKWDTFAQWQEGN